jgi:uncharacterized protein
MQLHKDEDAFMVPGMGAHPVPVKEWVPANDNIDVRYYGARGNALNQSPVDLQLATETFAPLEQLPVAEQPAASIMYTPLNVMPHAGGYVETTTTSRPSMLPSGSRTVPAVRASGDRHGDWLQTYTGKQFWPMDPRSQEVDIRDIAHALSMQCRYAGHCRRFYSVAEHSTLIARWLVGKQRDAALYGLLHDASEAYLVDVPRPVKPFLTGYAAAEARVMAAIWSHFGLGPDVPAIVKEADDRILADELVNMTRMSWHARHCDGLGVPMMYWSPAEAEHEFLATYAALTGEVV